MGMTARVAALLTCKGLFSSVCELVLLEVFCSSETIVTLLAPERLLSSMFLNVCLQVTSLCAGELTLLTLERLFS